MCGSPLSDVGIRVDPDEALRRGLDPQVVEREAGLVVDEPRADRLPGPGPGPGPGRPRLDRPNNVDRDRCEALHRLPRRERGERDAAAGITSWRGRWRGSGLRRVTAVGAGRGEEERSEREEEPGRGHRRRL